MEPSTEAQRFLRRFLCRLLFVEAPPSSSNHIKGTETHSIVTVLLRRRRLTRLQPFVDAATALGSTISSRRDGWGVVGVQLYGPAPVERPVVFFMELTRRYRVTRWLCALKGQPAPPPYTLSLCPRFDAILGIRLTGPVTPGAVAGIRALVADAGVFDRPVLLGSGYQVLVYDPASDADVAARVNLCFLVQRPPGMTREACQDYWGHQHATLALDNMQYLKLTRYCQVHTLETPPSGLDDDYDGVVFAEKRSIGGLLKDLAKVDTTRFNNTVVVDESHFTYATPVMLMQIHRSW
jgi:hypothetical protein